MTRTLRTTLMALSLLLCAGWMLAQQGGMGKSGDKSDMAQSKVEGCLQGSNGNFTLTDSAGKVYQLQGDASKLTEHVGHEVRVTGTASAAGSGSSMSSGAAQPVLQVDSVKHISKTCKAEGKMSK